MQSLATLLAITSGFVLTGSHAPPLNLIATSLTVDAMLAPITAVIAFRHGRSAYRWAVIGFAFGGWALAAALIYNPRRQPRPEVPPEAA